MHGAQQQGVPQQSRAVSRCQLALMQGRIKHLVGPYARAYRAYRLMRPCIDASSMLRCIIAVAHIPVHTINSQESRSKNFSSAKRQIQLLVMRTCPSVAAENTEDNLYVLLKMTFFVSRYNGYILQMRQIKVSYVSGVYLERTCSSVTSASAH